MVMQRPKTQPRQGKQIVVRFDGHAMRGKPITCKPRVARAKPSLGNLTATTHAALLSNVHCRDPFACLKKYSAQRQTQHEAGDRLQTAAYFIQQTDTPRLLQQP